MEICREIFRDKALESAATSQISFVSEQLLS
jgi:hypothetical protein